MLFLKNRLEAGFAGKAAAVIFYRGQCREYRYFQETCLPMPLVEPAGAWLLKGKARPEECVWKSVLKTPLRRDYDG